MEPKQGRNGNFHVNNYFFSESFGNDVGEPFLTMHVKPESFFIALNSCAPILMIEAKRLLESVNGTFIPCSQLRQSN